ncbi:hypothetical protein MMC29_001352 [Sticta canariensis]|nr:hypothetical protein [Sticta canariensis]
MHTDAQQIPPSCGADSSQLLIWPALQRLALVERLFPDHYTANLFKGTTETSARCPQIRGGDLRPLAVQRHSVKLLSSAAGHKRVAPAASYSADIDPLKLVTSKIAADPNRCERAYVGNTIGQVSSRLLQADQNLFSSREQQRLENHHRSHNKDLAQANAVADRLLDLRKCSYVGKDLSKKVLSGALLVDSDLTNATLIETVLTKRIAAPVLGMSRYFHTAVAERRLPLQAIATNSSFAGADMTNAVIDRVDFRNADLSGAKFHNTVVTGSVFTGAKMDGVSFEDALIGREDVKKLLGTLTLNLKLIMKKLPVAWAAKREYLIWQPPDSGCWHDRMPAVLPMANHGLASDQSDASGVYMACLFQANQLGLAFYDPVTTELSVLQSHDNGSPGPMGHQMLQLAKMAALVCLLPGQKIASADNPCVASRQHASPQMIFTSSKADSNFLACLKQPTAMTGQTDEAEYDVRIKKSTIFHLRAAMACLRHLHVEGMPSGLSGADRLHLMGSLINMACTQQLCALGALLSILHQEGVLAEEDAPEAGIAVSGLSEVALDGFLMVDAASLYALQVGASSFCSLVNQILQSCQLPPTVGCVVMLRRLAASAGIRLQADKQWLASKTAQALHVDLAWAASSASAQVPGGHAASCAVQVFQQEHHPSIMGVGQAKEGLSVYGMLNKCVTSMGRRLLQLWLLRPIINLEMYTIGDAHAGADLVCVIAGITGSAIVQVIRERQDAVSMFMHAPADSLKSLKALLSKIKDVPKILQRLRVSQGTAAKDFGLLSQSLASLTLLKHTMLSPELLCLPRGASSAFASSTGIQSDPASLPHHHSSGRSGGAPSGIVRKAFICIDDSLQTCHSLITSVIDADQDNEMVIAPGVSNQLDELKLAYAGLPSMLTHVVEQELQRIPRSLRQGCAGSNQTWSIIYMPQVTSAALGWVRNVSDVAPHPHAICQHPSNIHRPGSVTSCAAPKQLLSQQHPPQVGFVTRLEGQRLTADLQDCLPDYQFAFEGSGVEVGGMYYYSDATRELNAEVGDMLHKIHDFEAFSQPERLEQRAMLCGQLCRTFGISQVTILSLAVQGTLCTELLRRVAAHGSSLAQAVSVAAEVDCLISLATSAADFDFQRPVLTSKNELRIKAGKPCCTLI